jgi:hypothetical protein
VHIRYQACQDRRTRPTSQWHLCGHRDDGGHTYYALHAVGDRVQRRDQPWLRGTVWSIGLGVVIVQWDDEDPEDPAENACFHEPQRWLQKITPAPRPRHPRQGHAR